MSNYRHKRKQPRSTSGMSQLSAERAAWRTGRTNGEFRWCRQFESATNQVTYTFTWLSAESMVFARYAITCTPDQKDAAALAKQLRAVRAALRETRKTGQYPFAQGSLYQRIPSGQIVWFKAY